MHIGYIGFKCIGGCICYIGYTVRITENQMGRKEHGKSGTEFIEQSYTACSGA